MTLTIGREDTNALAIDSPFVSSAHARVLRDGSSWVIEDLQSANGTRVNGQPVVASALMNGDVIEVGDQRLIFVDRSEAAPAQALGPRSGQPNRKALRLGIVALLTLGLMTVLLMRLRPAADSPPSSAGGGVVAPGPSPSLPAGPPPPLPTTTSPLVAEVVQRAERSGISPVAALVDEGHLAMRGGRFREARQLYAAAAAREPGHAVAERRLAEATLLLEQQIGEHLGRGERLFARLRYEEAMLEWEQVLLLAEPPDPRAVRAQDGIQRARERLKGSGAAR
jgi:hypothetical protein